MTGSGGSGMERKCQDTIFSKRAAVICGPLSLRRVGNDSRYYTCITLYSAIFT